MDYLDYELQRYQEEQEATCPECGGCLLDAYYDCTCEEEEEIIDRQIQLQK